MGEHDDTAGALLPFDEGAGEGARIVRRQWHNGRWYFSVVDVVAILTDSPRPRKYWSDLKTRLENVEGFTELSAKIGQLKMRSVDGKAYKTDAADAETLLRIVQSIPSPKAEPVKQWLARVGTERIQELADADALAGLTEAQRRILARQQLAEQNRELAAAAQGAGVISAHDFAIFQDHGYRGLYAGESARDIAERKGLPRGAAILDWMGSEELAANLFRSTQAEARLRREGIENKADANRVHHDTGAAVRRFIIEELGGTPPEQLPTPAQSVQAIEARERRRIEEAQDRGARPSLFPELDTRGDPGEEGEE